MSTETVISMRELEAESAELLPSRETLCCWKGGHSGSSSTVFQYGAGNTAQSGNFDISAFNGNTISVINLGGAVF
jgi:hypothetical protein